MSNAAATFINQTPPGELNDVLGDLRVLLGDDGSLDQSLEPALESYNVAQLIVASASPEHQVGLA